MLFNSYVFVLLFLPVTLIGYYILNHFQLYKISNAFLIAMSLYFYGYFNKSYLIIICGSIVVNFFLSKFMQKSDCIYVQKIVLLLGICSNIAVIFYFKYYDFFIQNINGLFHLNFNLKNILLPLGISFFTFQQISFLVDSYRGETSDYNFIEYALFVSFFPQLVAGPIVLHNEIIPQFRDINKRKFISAYFARGLYFFAIGVFKKVIIADTFGNVVSLGFGTIPTLTSMEALIVSLSYTFQLYFDFSGYCDMAIGIGCMFNVDLPHNFNSPYKSTSIMDFWSRWHMSLTRFLRAYIYIPLGGNRKGKKRTYINIMIVFLISGIWHGANFTFVLWGLLHGILNCLNRMFEKKWDKVGTVTQWAITFMLVNGLWILFRADSISQAICFFKRLYTLSDFWIRPEFFECFNLLEIVELEKAIPFLSFFLSQITGFNLWMFIIGSFAVVLNCSNSGEIQFKPTVATSLITVLFMVWSIMSFAGVSSFLYFDF